MKKIKQINKEELRKKTWEYFWQQKAKEIMITFIIILGLTIVPYILSSFGCFIYPNLDKFLINNNSYACTLHQAWYKFYVMGLAMYLFIVIISFLIYIISYSIKTWIQNNWEEAEKRAMTDLR